MTAKRKGISDAVPVGRVPSRGVPEESPARRLRRMHHVWPDRDGNLSYLLTICVDGRGEVLDNPAAFEQFVAFLLDSPERYDWFGRRFVMMPDHIHLIARMGHNAIRLSEWIKAMKAVVGGIERRKDNDAVVGRMRSRGDSESSLSNVARPHEFTCLRRTWRWQRGFHDHKFRTRESESRKWEYICLNPVRYGLAKRPEEWPFGGEIFYDEGTPTLVRGAPPLLDSGILIEEIARGTGRKTPREGTRPTA